MYAPSIEQTLDWYHISQLRLPTYRFRHNARFHPYIRYVETDPLMVGVLAFATAHTNPFFTVNH